MYEILKYFPLNIASIIDKKIKSSQDDLQEIRVRTNCPIILKFNETEYILAGYIITYEDIMQIMQNICNNSIYSFQNEIINGYITINGGHRVGITGSVVQENGRVINIKNISSLNFRIAKQVLDCSNSVLKYIIDLKNNTIFNTLIVSSPGARKNYFVKGFS